MAAETCLDIPWNTSACAYVLMNCKGDDFQPGFVNYLEFIYCQVDDTGRPWAILLLFVYVLFLFVFIATVAGDYLSPNITSLAHLLRIPSDVAGVTLVAWGNAASDLVGNIISFSKANAGALAIGELLGSGLFLTCIVVGSLGWMSGSEGVPLAPAAVIRDTSVYFLGLVIASVLLITGYLYRWQGIFFLCLYALYVVLVLLMANDAIRSRLNHSLQRLSRSLRKLPKAHDSQVNLDDGDEGMPDALRSEPQVTLDYPVIQIEDFDEIPVDSDLVEPSVTPRSLPSPEPNMEVLSPKSQSSEFLQVPGHSGTLCRESQGDTVSGRHGSRSDSLISDRSSRHGSGASVSVAGRTPSVRSTQRRLPRLYREYTPKEQQLKELDIQAPSRKRRSPSPQPDGTASPIPHDENDQRSTLSRHLRRLSSASSAERSVSDNIVSLRVNDSLSENLHGSGLLGALELWDAWTLKNRRSRQSTTEEIVPEVRHQSVVGQSEPNSDLYEPAIELYALSPISSTHSERQRHVLSLMDVADRCPTCFKSTSTEDVLTVRAFCRSSKDAQPKLSMKNAWTLFAHHTFLQHYFPIVKLWFAQGWLARILSVLNTFPVLIFASTIPVICYHGVEAERSVAHSGDVPSSCGTSVWVPWRHRSINLIQLSLFPFMVVLLTNSFSSTVFSVGSYSFQAWLLALIIGFGFACILAALTQNGYRIIWMSNGRTMHCGSNECLICKWRRPRTWSERLHNLLQKDYWLHLECQPFLCVFGVALGLCWIYAISSEIIGALKALGKALHVSDAILGVTVFALGNSVGDLATNVMIARLGFFSMAVGASWAGPMLNLLITLGVALTILTTDQNGFELQKFQVPTVLYSSLAALSLVLLCNLLVLGGYFRFKLTRSYGVLLIAFWFIVLMVNVLVEIFAK